MSPPQACVFGARARSRLKCKSAQAFAYKGVVGAKVATLDPRKERHSWQPLRWPQ